MLAREGNTLSPVVRNAWDGKPLQTIAKNAPVRATGAHIAIIGHITKDELLRFVSGTELANGFVNRFLLVGVRRSQELPFGGRLDGEQLARVRDGDPGRAAVRQPPPPAPFDPQRGSGGSTVYGPLSAARKACSAPPPAAQKRTSSASPRSTPRSTPASRSPCRTSKPRSRSGATASTPPAGSSATRLGDPTADEIWALAKDRPAGVTRSEVRDLFSRNKKAREIDRALTVLEEAGRLTRTTVGKVPEDKPRRGCPQSRLPDRLPGDDERDRRKPQLRANLRVLFASAATHSTQMRSRAPSAGHQRARSARARRHQLASTGAAGASRLASGSSKLANRSIRRASNGT